MSLSPKAKNRAANAIVAETISLHSGPPGADGLANELPTTGGIYSRGPIAFGPAVNGVRQQLADVVQGTPPGSSVAHYVIWDEEDEVVKVGAFVSTVNYVEQGEHKTKQGTLTITG